MNVRTSLFALAALAALCLATPADAAPASQTSAGIGSTTLSGWLVLDPGPIDGVGAGFRLSFPLSRGIVQHPRIKDEFVLEPGIDFVHYHHRVGWYPNYVSYDWNGLLFAVGGAWQFWFTPSFALYPKLDLGWWYGWYRGWDNRYNYARDDFDGIFIQGAVGLIYRVNRAQLRLELGSGLLRLGVGFAI